MPIEAVLDRIIVKVVEKEGLMKSKGGILLAGGHGQQSIAKVISVGPGRPTMTAGVLNPVGVQEGEYVMFHPDSGHPISVDGENYWVLLEENIFGKVSLQDADVSFDDLKESLDSAPTGAVG